MAVDAFLYSKQVSCECPSTPQKVQVAAALGNGLDRVLVKGRWMRAGRKDRGRRKDSDCCSGPNDLSICVLLHLSSIESVILPIASLIGSSCHV